MVAEVEVLEFNNKINKEVKMFLVVLSSDIKASWNWCQKPQALKKKIIKKCRDWIVIHISNRAENGNLNSTLLHWCFLENAIARKRLPAGERRAFQDWLVKHMLSNVTGGRESAFLHIFGKKAIMQKGKRGASITRGERQPLVPAIDAEDNQALGKPQTDGEDRQHATRTTFPHESQT